MSSILKALKKLEQEKAVRKPDSFRIDSEILRGSVQRSPVAKGASLAAIALFLCGVGVTYLIMRQDRAPAAQPQTPAIEVRVDAPSPVIPMPVPLKTAEPQARLPEKKSPAADAPLTASRPGGKQQASIQKAAETPQKPSPPPGPNPVAPALPAVPVASPPSAPAKPALKVLGIAYQDGAENAAVINGVTVTKGSVIEGARIEDIQKDHVTFSRGGEKFEVFLDKSN